MITEFERQNSLDEDRRIPGDDRVDHSAMPTHKCWRPRVNLYQAFDDTDEV